MAGEEVDMRVFIKDIGEESHRVRGRIVVDKRVGCNHPSSAEPCASISVFRFRAGHQQPRGWTGVFANNHCGPRNVLSLPPEILCQIFDSDALRRPSDHRSRVCKSWCDIVVSPDIWMRVPPNIRRISQPRMRRGLALGNWLTQCTTQHES